jgi:TolB protein
VSNRGGKPQLWTIGFPTAGVPKQITTDAQNSRSAWSPDGGKLAFTSSASGSSQIWLVDSTGAMPATQLTHDAVTADSVPTWSPDGLEIAFNGASSGRTEIFKIKVSGSGELQLTSGPATNAGPSWCCLTAP